MAGVRLFSNISWYNSLGTSLKKSFDCRIWIYAVTWMLFEYCVLATNGLGRRRARLVKARMNAWVLFIDLWTWAMIPSSVGHWDACAARVGDLMVTLTACRTLWREWIDVFCSKLICMSWTYLNHSAKSRASLRGGIFFTSKNQGLLHKGQLTPFAAVQISLITGWTATIHNSIPPVVASLENLKTN